MHNFKHRSLIRKTWGSHTVLNQNRAKVIFVLGRGTETRIETAVRDENSKFNDIVQGSFLDSYYNLTYKSITAVSWLRHYCKSAKLIVKVDDDIVLDIKKVMAEVSPYQNVQRHFMCYFHKHGPVVRNKNHKFYVSEKELNSSFYPRYCNGWIYCYTADIVEELCKALEQTKLFKIEDVWTTGFVLGKLPNITRVHMPMLFTGRNSWAKHGVKKLLV